MHTKPMSAAHVRPWAVFSECERYRYVLSWPADRLGTLGTALFCLANPSTATAEVVDPTVARCIAYAKRWGYRWCQVVNVRAWRETDPKKVPADPLAIGPENDKWITETAAEADIVVVGWGKLGGERGPVVLDLIRCANKVPHALKLNKDGSPGHPLYLRADAQPFPMRRA